MKSNVEQHKPHLNKQSLPILREIKVALLIQDRVWAILYIFTGQSDSSKLKGLETFGIHKHLHRIYNITPFTFHLYV